MIYKILGTEKPFLGSAAHPFTGRRLEGALKILIFINLTIRLRLVGTYILAVQNEVIIKNSENYQF